MSERDAERGELRRALQVLARVQHRVTRALVEELIEQEHDLPEAGAFDFTFQQIEDRFATRLVHLERMLALVGAQARGTGGWHAEVIRASPEDLAGKLQEWLDRIPAPLLKDVKLQALPDGEILALIIHAARK